jgi:hypothetical protein
MVIASSLAVSPSRSFYTATAVSPLSVFLPKEHGSWSLALEPILLGLLVAPSGGGIALAVAAMAGFFARRTFKATLFRSSQPRPGTLTAGILLALSVCVGLGEATAMAGAVCLWPLLLATPFGSLFVYFDAQGDSRAVAAESAGSMAFALLPAAFATLAGWPILGALGLASISVTRSVPTILTVRTYLRRRKGRPASPFVPVLAAMLGCVVIVTLAAIRLTSWLVAGGTLLLLVRTVWFVSKWSPVWSAKRIGITESVLGLVFVALVAIAYKIQ